MARYENIQSGEWVFPEPNGYKLACCDCGLVHRMDFKVNDGNILFRAERDDRPQVRNAGMVELQKL